MQPVTLPGCPQQQRPGRQEKHNTQGHQAEFAEAGIADASFKLGNCYYNTRSIPMNFVKAVQHYRAAAEQGHPEAFAKLAECYEWGVGVEANAEEAAKWKNK